MVKAELVHGYIITLKFKKALKFLVCVNVLMYISRRKYQKDDMS